MVIHGKLYLEPRLYRFLVAFENIENNMLDLNSETLIRLFIKQRLQRKTDIVGTHRKAYQCCLNLIIPKPKQNNLCVFLSPLSMVQINQHVLKFFTELANSHVLQYIKEGMTREQAFDRFLMLYELTTDDFDIDNLIRSDIRLRAKRNIEYAHYLRKKGISTALTA